MSSSLLKIAADQNHTCNHDFSRQIHVRVTDQNLKFSVHVLPLGFPSPKMTTLSLGGAVAPSWLKFGSKYPAKMLEAT